MVTLKNILRTNATSCLIFGALFLLMPSGVANFLSTEKLAPVIIIEIMGAALILNGVHLIWVSFQARPAKKEIIYFAVGDFIWVIATIVLIALGIWITSPIGIIAALLVATMVGTFGALQIIKQNRD